MTEVQKRIENFIYSRADVECALVYGSGFFKQSGYSKKDKPMIDTIFFPKSTKDFYRKNLILKPTDYTLTGKLYASSGCKKLYSSGGKINYNAGIKENGLVFKTGVVDYQDGIESLTNWGTFFLAGRLQKPVFFIKSTPEFLNAVKKNRENAIKVALLLSNDGDSIEQLYQTIVSLSYKGDSRNFIAENPHKVQNIVNGSFEQFEEIYGSSNEYFYTSQNKITIDHLRLIKDILTLPQDMINNILVDDNSSLIEIRQNITKYLSAKNSYESIIQTLKGIASNGPVISATYGLQKVKKRFK